MNNNRVIGILFSLFLIIFFFFKCASNEKVWVENIKLSEDIKITDTVQYSLDNALLFADKNEVKIVLQDIVDEFNEMVRESDNIKSDDLHLLTHLDSILGKFILDRVGYFQTKVDTMSVGQYKSTRVLEIIRYEDWEKDTVRIIRDFNDERNYYFNSLYRVSIQLIEKNKVKIFNKETKEEVQNIILKHHSFGYNYESHYEFKNGKYIIGKELILGF